MAKYYCDHNAYASALGATPTWGVPQEGDGSSKDPATAAGTAAIVLTANVAAGNTISVCGVTFTAVASGATGNQFNVGASLTASITNIVTAINASTTAVATGVAPGAPQLRNLVFARNTGGTTLEVMMRVGSATLNGANNTNCRLTGSGISTSTTLPVNFAGGSGGCWGLLMNTAAMGVSNSYAVLAYGLMVLATPICAASNASATTIAVPTIDDDIECRTGAGFTITLAANGVPAIGTPNYNQNLIFDSNTVWTGDSGTGQITVAISISSAESVLRLAPNTAALHKSVRCRRRGGLRFHWISSNGSGSPNLNVNSTSGSRATALWDGVTFETISSFNTGSGSMRITTQGVSAFCAVRMRRCNFFMREARSTWGGLISFLSGDGALILEGCTTEVNHTAGSDPGPIVGSSVSLTAGTSIRLIGCSFSGWSFGRHRAVGPVTFANGTEITFDGCTGISLGSSYANATTNTGVNPNYATVIIQSQDAGLGYRYEYGSGVVDWNPDAAPAYPTRSALLGNNTTPWSIKLDWFATSFNPFNHLSTPKMGTINRLSSAVRTVAVDFLTPVTVTTQDVAIRVQYVSTDDKVYVESTYASATALSSPGATWAGISNFPSHSSQRLTLTTANAVKTGTEIAVFFDALTKPPGGSGIQLYVDPEFTLT